MNYKTIIAFVYTLFLSSTCHSKSLSAEQYLADTVPAFNLSSISGRSTNTFYINTVQFKKGLLYLSAFPGKVDINNWHMPDIGVAQVGETVYPFISDSINGQKVVVGGKVQDSIHGYRVPLYYVYPSIDKAISEDERELDCRFIWMILVISKVYDANVYITDDPAIQTTDLEKHILIFILLLRKQIVLSILFNSL